VPAKFSASSRPASGSSISVGKRFPIFAMLIPIHTAILVFTHDLGLTEPAPIPCISHQLELMYAPAGGVEKASGPNVANAHTRL
jgi:hypothetical protein